LTPERNTHKVMSVSFRSASNVHRTSHFQNHLSINNAVRRSITLLINNFTFSRLHLQEFHITRS